MALESFMLGGLDPAMLKDGLDRFDLYRMWAWGHPHGLGSGTMPEALTDLTRHVDSAAGVGADVMRICAGGRRARKLAWAEHRPLLLLLLHRAADYAGGRGVLAIENHVDLSTDEMLPDADTAGLVGGDRVKPSPLDLERPDSLRSR